MLDLEERILKHIAAFVFALLLPVAASAATTDSQKATDAAKSWLGLVDANDYAQSWNTAGAFLQRQITEAQWETSGKAVRGPLGLVMARKIVDVDFATTLPGAPDGQYAVVHFATWFTNKASATETVAMVMDGGVWKVIGYHIR